MKTVEYEAMCAGLDAEIASEWLDETASTIPDQVKHPLDDIEAFLRMFVSYPSDAARVAHTLWIAHTHAMDAAESTPRLAFLSPEPGSGKSRALEVTELLVPNPVEAINVTPAYLFRKVGSDDGRPTILYDEIDTVFGPKAKDNEEIRGLLNAGHRKHATAGRCVMRGKIVETEEIPAYCAVALAGLGGLPDTILSRSIIIKMRRRSSNEKVTPFRRRLYVDQGHLLRDRLAQWMASINAKLVDAWPVMPEGIADRDADVWEALLAIADQAGGEWSQRARVAAVTLVSESKENTPSLGVRLLGDLKLIFRNEDRLTTDEIINRLCHLQEAPWTDLRGRPIDARGLANMLRNYGVKSKTLRTGNSTPKGYVQSDLVDAWSRYLPPSSENCKTSATSATNAGSVLDVAHVLDLPSHTSIEEL